MNILYDHNTNLYKPETVHMSLFRARFLFEDEKMLEIFKEIQSKFDPLEFKVNFFDISTMEK